MFSTSSSSGLRLNFKTQEEYDDYEQEEEMLVFTQYKKLRDKYGVWATNQNCYVRNRIDFNPMDSTFMEELYDKYMTAGGR